MPSQHLRDASPSPLLPRPSHILCVALLALFLHLSHEGEMEICVYVEGVVVSSFSHTIPLASLKFFKGSWEASSLLHNKPPS